LYGNLQTLEATVVTQQSAVGQIVDIGLTAEMMELTSAGIMADSVTAVLAQSTQMSESVLKLL
jgi:flagellin-like hook-associated protein FlgL